MLFTPIIRDTHSFLSRGKVRGRPYAMGRAFFSTPPEEMRPYNEDAVVLPPPLPSARPCVGDPSRVPNRWSPETPTRGQNGRQVDGNLPEHAGFLCYFLFSDEIASTEKCH
ncbi:hypothetical protein TNCV_3661571 [Trichonephila clavipes]|nr:hypothetical protein TNCV_3661571 [Trichonephila clavipes]